MKHQERYSSLPDNFRKHFLDSINKPVNERTTHDLQCIRLGEKWIALEIESAEARRKTEEFQREIEETKREIEEARRETEEARRESEKLIAGLTAQAHEILTKWEAVAREELTKAGFSSEDRDLDELMSDVVSSGVQESPVGMLVCAIWQAKKSENRQKPEVGFMAGLLMATSLVKMGRSELLDFALSILQSKRSKGVRRRPRFPTKRVIRCAVARGCTTGSEVETYLEATEEVTDKWGLMVITDNGDFFTVEDMDGRKNEDRKYPEGKVYKSRLAVLVSQVRKEK